jgi:hypothetical protein
LTHADEVYVGCPGGRLVRIGRSTGAIRASRDALPVDQYTDALDLGYGALAVSGFASGAMTVTRVGLVRGNDLASIVPARTDATVLGAIGDTAIIVDWCCFGRSSEAAPATIYRVNLRTGSVAAPVDLQPDAKRFTPERRPLGIGAHSALSDGRLYFAIPPMLYDYGDAKRPAPKPTAVLDTLATPPEFMLQGSALVKVLRPNGATNELVDLRTRPPRVIWQRDASGPYEAAVCADLICAGRSEYDLVMLVGRPEESAWIVRWDGASAVVPSGCRTFATSAQMLVVGCRPELLDANGNAAQSIEGYAFTQPAP